MPGPFVERLKDITVDRVVAFGDGSHQVEGTNLDGERIWLNVRIAPIVAFEQFKGKDEEMIIEADHYREEENNLRNDPIIREMADEVWTDLCNGRVSLDDISFPPPPKHNKRSARHGFMNRCNIEYRRRLADGKPNFSHSIGGCARAILSIIEDRRDGDGE